MKTRNREIDVARGCVIILVMIGHLVLFDSYIFKWIFSFHMPFFFILSGYCSSLPVKERTLIKHFVNLTKSLLIPSIIVRILSLVIGLVIVDTIEDGLYLIWASSTLEWFFISLLFAQFLFWFYLKIVKIINCKYIDEIMVLIIIAITPYAIQHYVALGLHDYMGCPIPIDCALIGFSFLLIGYMLRKRNCIQLMLETKNFLVFFTLLYSIVIILIINNTYVNVANVALGKSDLFFYIGAILGTLFIFIISKIIVEKCTKDTSKNISKRILSFLELYGRNGMIIYPGHAFLYFYFNKIMLYIFEMEVVPMVNLSVQLIALYIIGTFVVFTPLLYFKEKLIKARK